MLKQIQAVELPISNKSFQVLRGLRALITAAPAPTSWEIWGYEMSPSLGPVARVGSQRLRLDLADAGLDVENLTSLLTTEEQRAEEGDDTGLQLLAGVLDALIAARVSAGERIEAAEIAATRARFYGEEYAPAPCSVTEAVCQRLAQAPAATPATHTRAFEVREELRKQNGVPFHLVD